MTGFLVVNHYLSGEKYSSLHSHLKKTAEKMNISLRLKTNEQMLFESERPDFVLFWDKDVNLAKSLENKGVPVFNSARSIALCDDKAKTYLALENKLKQPKTIIAPLSFFEVDYGEFVKNAGEVLGFPLVIKNCCGSFGEQVHLCRNMNEVLKYVTREPFLLQEYIECGGEDVRIEVVGNRVVAAMKRKNEHDFRSNITNGGTAEKYNPTDKECEIALTACRELGLTFGGVDIMSGDTLCEVNSNAHIMNIMHSSGVDVAPLIFEEILRKI